MSAFVLSLLSVSFVFTIARHIPLGNAIPIKQDSAALNEVFQDIEAAFVVTDRNKNQYVRYNSLRCQQRFSPYSTFKIPNS